MKYVKLTLFPLCMVKRQELSMLVLYQPENSDLFERIGVMRLWPLVVRRVSAVPRW